MRSRNALTALACLYVLVTGAPAAAQEQLVDPEFEAVVDRPAYPQDGPVVAIDEAHANFHTASGQYRPFADLLARDGYVVRPSTVQFAPGALQAVDVLVIANARPRDMTDPKQPAFTDEECDVVADWVQAGGSLLLIADHAPFGSAAENLARRFDVSMGKGWVFDLTESGGITTQLDFSRDKGSLGDHPILRGRSSGEEIRTTRTFTGQSLGVPDGATVLLPLGPTAREAATPDDLNAEGEAARAANGAAPKVGPRSTPVSGRAQGLALTFGRGRVVVLGEAGFLSAQLIRFPDGREMRFGMNVPGYDNQQFALNVMRWLSRLL